MAEKIVNKVTFKKTFLISIKYSEGNDGKLLESNEEFNKPFRENLQKLRENLNSYLGFDGEKQTVFIVDSITFANTEKQSVKLTFQTKFNAQYAGVGISLLKGDAYLKITEEDEEENALVNVYKNISELQQRCLNYLEGERAQQDLPM